MTVHFAAARTAATSPLARALVRRRVDVVANDNDDGGNDDLLLRAALQHFAQHGLSAASEARKQAESAFFSGDRQNYDWWLGVCRTLDRRMAEEFARSTARA